MRAQNFIDACILMTGNFIVKNLTFTIKCYVFYEQLSMMKTCMAYLLVGMIMDTARGRSRRGLRSESGFVPTVVPARP